MSMWQLVVPSKWMHQPSTLKLVKALRSCGHSGSSFLIDRIRHWIIVGSVGPLHWPGRQRSHASAGQPGRPEGEDQLGPARAILGRAAGGRSGGRTRCALLTRYAFGDDTIGSRGFIAAVTRTAGPRPFGGAGL